MRKTTKFLSGFLLAMLTVFSLSLSAVTVTIGTGTTSSNYPFTTYWMDGRTQMLYPASEITANGGVAGNITSIAFNVISNSTQVMNSFTVRMQNTTATSIAAFVETGWTTVLTTNWAVPGTGWQTINLATPFAWDGTSNLLIEICYDNSSYDSYSPVYSTAAAGMTWGRYQDLSTASGCTITGGSAQANRPNIRMEITPAYTGVATVAGVVTNAVTGAPIVGAFVKIGDSTTYTIGDGSYSLNIPPTTLNVLVKKTGFVDYTTTVTGVANNTTTLNVAMQENTPAPGVVFASLNTAQTAVTITWGLPQSSYEIVYDDGVFENMTSWAVAGNINALKFTPINSYPLQVTGGKVNIGDGSYPSGANLQSFTMAVYKDDGPLGYPGTELATVDVTPTHYGWVEFTFPTPVTITSGNFYLGMIQGGNYPNCVPIAIDETNPSMRSYSRFVTGNAPWVLAGYNDFMIRATVYGAGGPLDLTANTNAPRFIEKQRISAASRFMKQPKVVSGYEGEANYIPTGDGEAPESLLGYQVWRLKQGEENTPANWVSVGTPTATSIIDNSWPTIANGAYRWAVKAKYSNDRWSDAVFSNVLGKGWTSNVTFNITLSSAGAVPSGVSIQMQNTAPYADSAYYALTGPSGTVNFPHVWKGNYNITVQKFGYDIYTANVDIVNDSYTFDITLMESRWAPTNLYVDDRTLLATWNAPVVQVALLEERWTSGSFATNQWVAAGSNWGVTTSIGNPAPSAMFNWSPQATNYEQSLTSKEIQGVGSPVLKLNYDIYLDNFGTTNENQMAVEIWDGAAWNRLKNYSNLSGSIPWTSESIDISAYTWDTFKIRFVAYGTDTYDINNWNIDNILVVASLSDKNLLGYGVYLDDIQIGFTTETQYQIPHNLCTYGQTYTASVDANYESGVSDRDYYTFVAHYLPAPRNLAATAVQDAAYLTWEQPVMGSKVNILDQSPRTSMPDPNVEYSPMVTVQEVTNATEAIWDVLFTFNAAGAARPGVETDGTYIYTAQWNGANFGKFQNQGGTWTLVSEFTISGASNIRDLAYDGTYFYGGSAATTIYKMDFNTQTLVGTINTSGVNVRHISYDPVNNGFWTGNWSDMYLVSTTGATLQTANPGLSGMYGNAYDGVSAGGPYLWIFDQNGSGVDIQQMSIATGTLTGVVHAATDLPGFVSGSIAGGLASDNGNLVPGKFILLANVQQDPNLVGAYEVAASTGGGGGATPSTLLGYNIYRDGNFVAYVEKPTQEYYDLYLNPGHYCYTVTAVYDLEPYGFPAGTTAESLENGNGPACIDINYGIPIPWTEDWATANFTFNSWSFAPAQGHWRISNMTGNAVPSAEFTWSAPETDYSYALVSSALNASVFNCAEIYLDFDLKLDDRNNTGAEKLTVDVYWDGQWHKVAEYKNEGSFNWSTKHIAINQTAGKALKVRFVANGANTADILGWYVDNVSVYPVVVPATELAGQTQGFNSILTWNAPECQTGPAGTLKMLKQWDGDPNSNPNAYYQQYNYAYGVVYDLTAYPDATLSKIDFHHASWGTFGTWQYKIHVVDWNTFTEIATLGPLTTTGNDIWETNISLGDLMGFGGGLIGIMLEPLSNQATDAYPCFTADNDGPQGASVMGPLPDFSGFATSTVGDFYQNLYIYTALDGGKMVAAPKVVLNGSNSNAATRVPVVPNLRSVLSVNQKAINVPTDGGKGVMGYNIYRNGEKINNALVTNTTYTDNVGVNGTYCYVVKAVHEAFNGTMESAPTNEVCLTFTVGIDNPANTSISVYPNPARNFVNVQVGNDVKSLEMVNYLGQKVYTQQLNGAGKYTINTSNLESGVYFIRMTTANGSILTERVTVTK
ncbi:MAG: carboxypeptidase regulatory-like domain-containing protein [Bacteroidales bacterium]